MLDTADISGACGPFYSIDKVDTGIIHAKEMENSSRACRTIRKARIILLYAGTPVRNPIERERENEALSARSGCVSLFSHFKAKIMG